ncbi:MAG TPA: TadE family type IV pilus minor pilin [Nocardioidaceae bacterium]|nr:TadE family type IV pilus minor pilin [Nocardioidaceae bacterium]
MTAETAVVLPVVVAVALGLVWLVSLGVTQVRVVDAARETARAVARDEDPGVAVQLGERVAPPGASITVEERDGLVEVAVRAEVRGPGGIFRFLPSVDVDGSAVTSAEPT